MTRRASPCEIVSSDIGASSHSACSSSGAGGGGGGDGGASPPAQADAAPVRTHTHCRYDDTRV